MPDSICLGLSFTADVDNLSTRSHVPLTPYTSRTLGVGFGNPPSNTGFNLQTITQYTVAPPQPPELTVGIDNLTFCGNNLTVSHVNQLVDDYFDTVFDYGSDRPHRSGIAYQHFVTSPLGHAFFYNVIDGTDSVQYRLTFPGKALSAMSHELLWELLQACKHFNMRPTRLDVAIDDYTRRLEFPVIREALTLGNVKHFSRYKAIDSGLTGLVAKAASTIYLGSRSSDKSSRIYDKFPESKGAIDAIRFETEFKDELAKETFGFLVGVASLDEGLRLIAQFAVGSVDFVDRTSDSNISRCSRLSWWQEFLDAVGGSLKLSLPTVQATISKTIRFIEHSASKAFAKIALTKGYEWLEMHLESCLKDGLRRLNSADYALIETYKKRNRPFIDKAVTSILDINSRV